MGLARQKGSLWSNLSDTPRGRRELSDDPEAIAEILFQEHGLDNALEQATDGTTAAQIDSDNYQLSIWREVKGILIKRRNEGL